MGYSHGKDSVGTIARLTIRETTTGMMDTKLKGLSTFFGDTTVKLPVIDRRIRYTSEKTNRCFLIRPFQDSDSDAVIDILNYFFDHTFAAFPDHRVDYSFIEYIKLTVLDYPFYFIESEHGEHVGFGYLHPYDYSNVFDSVGELTMFVLPHFAGNGLGTKMLNLLTTNAREMGKTSLLSCISEPNEASLQFHKAHGFTECGRFKRIGLKKDRTFDIIWVQKFI